MHLPCTQTTPAPAFPPATACAFPAPRPPLLHLLAPPMSRPTGWPWLHPGQQQNPDAHHHASFYTSMVLLTICLLCTHCSHPITPAGAWPPGHMSCAPRSVYATVRSLSCQQREDNHGAPTTPPPDQMGKSDTEKAHPAILGLSPRCLSSPHMFFKRSLTQKQRKKGLAVGHVLEASKMQPPLLAEI